MAGNISSINNGISTLTYNYDADNKLTNLSSEAVYTYSAEGDRVRKDASGGWTEYVYFGAQPIAEKNSDGTWNDYIYANGQKIAMANNFDVRIHTHGTFDAGGEAAVWTLPLSGYVVKSGDRICWRQASSEPGGGLGVNFTNGTSNAWVAQDQDGNLTNSDNAPSGWHNRCVDLSPNAGLTVAGVWIGANNNAAAGTWDILFGDVSIISTDDTVTPLFWRNASIGLSSVWINQVGPTNLQAYVETTNPSSDMLQPDSTTTYYLGDQIGSARLLTSAGGWPVSSDIFYPFGQEQSGTTDPNHYKFTGKERDTESGLDYFGARYYGSTIGRFMSPDWADKPEAVPYSQLDNPQSLNLYGYVNNNPLSRVDTDGHIYNGSSDSGGTVDAGWYENAVARDQYVDQARANQEAQQQNTELAQNNTPAPPQGRTNSPAQGQEPGSTVVIPNPDGGTTTRKFGPDGKAEVDIDQGHGGPKHGGAPDPHAHDWDWGKKPPRQTPGRALTPEEQASIKRGVAAGAAAVGTGYIIYRVIRFLPSLAPPLWPTIPANAIIP